MAVTILPEVVDELRDHTNVLIEVRSAEERLAEAMRAVRAAIAAMAEEARKGGHFAELEGPKYVSPPVPLPGAQVMMVDFGSTPESLVRTVPELLVRQLGEAGVRDAVVGLPRRIGDRFATIESFAPAARAWLRGPLGRPLGPAPRRPPQWLLDIASEWLSGQAQPSGELLGVVFSAQTPLTWCTLRSVAGAVLDADHAPAVTVLTSDFSTVMSAATVAGVFDNMIPQAALTAASDGWTPRQVAAGMRGQRDVIRANAGLLAWAGVGAGRDARRMLMPRWEERTPKAGSHRPDVEQLCDILVPDGLWYQILSPGHLERLGGPPYGSVLLPDARVELTVGEPEQWLPGHPDLPTVQTRARELLAECLVTTDEAAAMARRRIQDAR